MILLPSDDAFKLQQKKAKQVIWHTAVASYHLTKYALEHPEIQGQI